MQITTKDKQSGRELTVDYNIGEVEGNPMDSIKGAINLFGADVVWMNLKSELATSVRDKIRPQLQAGIVDEDIVKSLADFKIGVRVSRAKDPIEKILGLLGKLDPEKRAEVLKLLKKG